MMQNEGLNPFAAKSAEPTEPVEQQEPEKVVEEVPSGTVKEILAWVDGDTDRAERALKAEEEGAQRKTLLDELKDVLDK